MNGFDCMIAFTITVLGIMIGLDRIMDYIEKLTIR